MDSNPNLKFEFNLNISQSMKWFWITLFVLVIGNILSIFLFMREEPLIIYRIHRLFYFDEEGNIPTFFNSFALILAGLSFLYIGNYYKKIKSDLSKFSLHWMVFAGLLIYVGFDDFVQIHEMVGSYIKDQFSTTGIFYFAWVIPAFFILLGFAAYFFNFVRALPKDTRLNLIVASIVFLAGGLGVELIGSQYFYQHGGDNIPYAMRATIEEFLEIAGSILFLRAGLLHQQKIQSKK